MMNEEKTTDEELFISIFEANIRTVIKIARAYTYNIQDREDLVNDIACELWKSFSKFKGESHISTWIYRVCLNTAMNYKRKKEKDPVYFSWEINKYTEDLHWLTEEDSSSDFELLYECINALNEINKAIILLYLDGNSHEEISAITGISKTNVGTRIARIKEQIKQLFTSKI